MSSLCRAYKFLWPGRYTFGWVSLCYNRPFRDGSHFEEITEPQS